MERCTQLTIGAKKVSTLQVQPSAPHHIATGRSCVWPTILLAKAGKQPGCLKLYSAYPSLSTESRLRMSGQTPSSPRVAFWSICLVLSVYILVCVFVFSFAWFYFADSVSFIRFFSQLFWFIMAFRRIRLLFVVFRSYCFDSVMPLSLSFVCCWHPFLIDT